MNETLDIPPPITMQDALTEIAAWERGETTFSPDGNVVALFLQRARINKLGTLASAGELAT